MLDLEYNSQYDDLTNTITVNHQAGFFSTCSVTLRHLIYVYKNNLTNKPVNIVWNSDIWGNSFYSYFQPCNNSPIFLHPNTVSPKDNGIMQNADFNTLSVLIDNFFHLAEGVMEIRADLIKRYSIDLERTAVVFYRGCDKYIELPKVHPFFYYLATENIPIESFNRVMIQTDQKFAYDYLAFNVKQPKFRIEEIPIIDEDIAMHFMTEKKNMTNYDLGRYYLAAIHIISKCKYVIMDTGNGPKWITLFRGSANNTCQLYPELKFFGNFV